MEEKYPLLDNPDHLIVDFFFQLNMEFLQYPLLTNILQTNDRMTY